MKALMLSATIIVLLFLAGCATNGTTTHGSDRVCTDPLLIHECRYGGDSDSGGGEGGEGEA